MSDFGRNYWAWGSGRSVGAARMLAIVLLVCACAADNAVLIADAGPSRVPAVSRGTILAMRPVRPRVEPGSAGAGATVLAGLARTADAGTGQKETQAAGPAMDFVVREAGGATIAVVQSNEQRFQVGDQVSIVRSDRTRLSRPGA